MTETGANPIREFKSRIPIADVVGEFVRLRKTGSNLMGLCPFHSERSPSFSVAINKGIYHCFGCQKSGDVISFVQEMQSVSFGEAVRILSGKFGVPIPPELAKKIGGARTPPGTPSRESLLDVYYKLNHFVARFYHQKLLAAEGTAARQYLADRGISGETIRKECLGFAPAEWGALCNFLTEKKAPLDKAEELGLIRRKNTDAQISAAAHATPAASADAGRSHYDLFRNRVIFPVLDPRGRVIAFGGRALGDDSGPKYLNSSESPVYKKGSHLFGLFHAQKDIRAENACIVVEGFMDCLSLQQAGVGNTVATLGTALTAKQAAGLKRLAKDILVVFDGDEAGIQAQSRAMETFLNEDVVVRGVTLPDEFDPDEFIREKGSDAFRALLSSAPYLLDQRILDLARSSGSQTEGKARALDQILPWLAKLSSETARLIRLDQLSGLFGIEVAILERRAKELRTQGARTKNPPVVSLGNNANPAILSEISDPTEMRFLELVLQHPELWGQGLGPASEAGSILEGIQSEKIRDLVLRILELAKAGNQPGAEILEWTENPKIRAILARGLVTADQEQGKESGTKGTGEKGEAQAALIREFKDLNLKLARRGKERRRDSLRAIILRADSSGQSTELARLMSEYNELVKSLERSS